jgi:hypothetical protein
MKTFPFNKSNEVALFFAKEKYPMTIALKAQLTLGYANFVSLHVFSLFINDFASIQCLNIQGRKHKLKHI